MSDQHLKTYQKQGPGPHRLPQRRDPGPGRELQRPAHRDQPADGQPLAPGEDRRQRRHRLSDRRRRAGGRRRGPDTGPEAPPSPAPGPAGHLPPDEPGLNNSKTHNSVSGVVRFLPPVGGPMWASAPTKRTVGAACMAARAWLRFPQALRFRRCGQGAYTMRPYR